MSELSAAWGGQGDDEAVYSSLGPVERRGGDHLSDILRDALGPGETLGEDEPGTDDPRS